VAASGTERPGEAGASEASLSGAPSAKIVAGYGDRNRLTSLSNSVMARDFWSEVIRLQGLSEWRAIHWCALGSTGIALRFGDILETSAGLT
jgi:hypothetical protein